MGVFARWSIPGALLAAALAVAAAIATPEPGFTAQLGYAGYPRLGLYALAGLILGLTAKRSCLPGKIKPLRAPKRAYLLAAIGLLAAIATTLVNAQRLRLNIADPFGPPLWIAAMLVALVYMALPLTRRIGWRPLWPTPESDKPARWAIIALAGLLAIAAATRIPNLANIPQGINPDEGDRASTAFDVLNGVAPPSWFDSGWFFINMVYFRLLAASLRLFGPDVAGGRMLSALCGVAFVGVIAWLGCRNFGWRIGLMATAFATGMMMTIQHSRLITEAGPTALLWALSIAGFLEGARSGRLWAWALAGVSGGLGLYFYPSARLWAAGAVITVVALLAYQRDRRLLPGVAVAAVASIIAAAPFLIHLLQHNDELARRYAQTAVLDPHNQERLAYLRPPESPGSLLALQFERTVGMFDRYPDGGGFLPTGRPIFGVPLAQLTLVGAVYLLVRSVRDVRLAVLSIWFWLGLSGVALTVETPDYLRSAGMLPSLCFVLAIPLMDLIDRAAALRLPERELLAGAVPAVIALVLLAPEVLGYFITFRNLPSGWGPETRAGQVVATLGESGPVYSLEANEHMVSSGWVRLLSPHAQRGRMPNPGRELPVLTPVGPPPGPDLLRPEVVPGDSQGFSIVFSPDPNQRTYFGLLRQLYPQAEFRDAGDQRTALVVSPPALAATQGVNLVDSNGATYVVDAFGQVPAELAVPADLTWWSGVRFSPSAASHITISGASSAQVRLDGVGVSATGDVDLLPTAGVHLLELEAHVGSPDEHIGLGVNATPITPRQTYRLMDAPWGLTARLTRSAVSDGSDTLLDAAVAMAFFDPELGFVVAPSVLQWSGSLVAARAGTYRMAFASEDSMHLQIDDQPVEVMTVGPDAWRSVGNGSQVQLSAGIHRVQVTLDISHGGRELARWNWVPPLANGAIDTSAEWSVVPPQVLRPETGALSAAAR